ncbi:histidine phosphatase family protein [Bacillus shivajii]|uniref:histidine phosphatase family protein n=1 Tax=Bacillus shivajii TaxID=1983719 RepID=UPI001CFB48CE|nr:histidine phosphatase family protein [Bacillus shivajii]UCZ54069.1 histidine phosphatase family protein [Bacillus shivajii]
MKLYLIRHGQSEANKKGIIQGHANFPLTTLGKKQAVFVGHFFSDVHLDAIYSSDLDRAYETAKGIEYHHPLSIRSWDQLREVGLGPLEGKSRDQVKEEFPQISTHSLLLSGVEGSETQEEITKRCRYVLDQLYAAHQNNTVALVSHGGFLSILLMYMIAGESWHKLTRPFIIGNTGISHIEYDENEQVKFHYINRTSHLEKGESLQSSTVLY